jgi:hypothetical protein
MWLLLLTYEINIAETLLLGFFGVQKIILSPQLLIYLKSQGL